MIQRTKLDFHFHPGGCQMTIIRQPAGSRTARIASIIVVPGVTYQSPPSVLLQAALDVLENRAHQ